MPGMQLDVSLEKISLQMGDLHIHQACSHVYCSLKPLTCTLSSLAATTVIACVGSGNFKHFLLRHFCHRVPRPPNLGLARQNLHVPQTTVRVHPIHLLQRGFPKGNGTIGCHEKSKIPFSYMLYAHSVKRAYRGTKPKENFR